MDLLRVKPKIRRVFVLSNARLLIKTMLLDERITFHVPHVILR